MNEDSRTVPEGLRALLRTANLAAVEREAGVSRATLAKMRDDGRALGKTIAAVASAFGYERYANANSAAEALTRPERGRDGLVTGDARHGSEAGEAVQNGGSPRSGARATVFEAYRALFAMASPEDRARAQNARDAAYRAWFSRIEDAQLLEEITAEVAVEMLQGTLTDDDV